MPSGIKAGNLEAVADLNNCTSGKLTHVVLTTNSFYFADLKAPIIPKQLLELTPNTTVGKFLQCFGAKNRKKKLSNSFFPFQNIKNSKQKQMITLFPSG